MSRIHFRARGPLPLCVYGATAILCWLTPSRLATHDGPIGFTSIANAVPTKALALAAVALLVVHFALALQGRLVMAVAVCWTVATVWMATVFAVALYEPKRWTWAIVDLVGILAVGSSACGLVVLAWQVLRRRLATDAQLSSRVVVALGFLMLAVMYAVRTPRGLGPFGPAVGLEEMAAQTAGFTVSLWIVSAVLLVGAVSRVVSSAFGQSKQLNCRR